MRVMDSSDASPPPHHHPTPYTHTDTIPPTPPPPPYTHSERARLPGAGRPPLSAYRDDVITCLFFTPASLGLNGAGEETMESYRSVLTDRPPPLNGSLITSLSCSPRLPCGRRRKRQNESTLLNESNPPPPTHTHRHTDTHTQRLFSLFLLFFFEGNFLSFRGGGSVLSRFLLARVESSRDTCPVFDTRSRTTVPGWQRNTAVKASFIAGPGPWSRFCCCWSFFLFLLSLLFIIQSGPPCYLRTTYSTYARTHELCESWGGRPGLPSLINLRFLWT